MEVTIDEIQYTDDPSGASPLAEQMVTVTGIATTENTTYPDRFAIQDGEGAWSGLFVRNIGYPVVRGDSLRLTGLVVETNGLTELDLLIDAETLSSGNPLPEPTALDPGDIGSDESYEAVLVKVVDVTVTDDDPIDWRVASAGECRVGRWSGYAFMPTLGELLDVTGVVGLMVSEQRIEPRDDEDIEPGSGVPGDLPTVVSLSQNLPNPFGGATGMVYTLPADGHVLLQVYSVAGRLVRTLVDEPRPAGRWSVAWDGLDSAGKPAANGVYFYRLVTGDETVEKRMVLIR